MAIPMADCRDEPLTSHMRMVGVSSSCRLAFPTMRWMAVERPALSLGKHSIPNWEPWSLPARRCCLPEMSPDGQRSEVMIWMILAGTRLGRPSH